MAALAQISLAVSRLFDFPFEEPDDEACTSSVTENFLAASPEVDETTPGSDWFYESAYSRSDYLWFGQVLVSDHRDRADRSIVITQIGRS